MAQPKEVIVTGINMPFLAMVWLIFKWSLASIPALFLLSMLGTMFWTLAAGAVAAILAGLGQAVR